MTAAEFQVKKPIDVIPNFVDLELLPRSSATDRSRASPPPARRCCSTSRTSGPVKRVLDVVRIFERVAREVDAVLLMVGEGPERSSAQALARRLGLSDRVRFLGTQQRDRGDRRPAPTCSCCPRSSSPSASRRSRRWRAACRWSAPTPAACPRWCATRESGYLLPVGDVEGMAARTIEILKDDERRREMGQAARHRVESLFGAERVVGQYEAVYARVLGR